MSVELHFVSGLIISETLLFGTSSQELKSESQYNKASLTHILLQVMQICCQGTRAIVCIVNYCYDYGLYLMQYQFNWLEYFPQQCKIIYVVNYTAIFIAANFSENKVQW